MKIENIDVYSLPSLIIPERYNLPEVGAVYFVLSVTGDVEYIGKAKNLRKRWRTHECCMNLDSPKTSRVAWIELQGEDERTELEKRLIRKFNPESNSNFTIKPSLSESCDVRSDIFEVVKLTTIQAAEKLGVSQRRVIAMIVQGRLKSEKFANVYMIDEKDLEAVKDRKNGRPRKIKP